MPLFNFKVVLYDTGLPYPDLESALKDCKEWAKGIGETENCIVAEATVEEEEEWDI